jgi:hypothetical protein
MVVGYGRGKVDGKPEKGKETPLRGILVAA